jgi:hypothetical protein
VATRREFLKRTVATGIAAALSRTVGGASEAARPHKPSGDVGAVQTILRSLDATELGFTISRTHRSSMGRMIASVHGGG